MNKKIFLITIFIIALNSLCCNALLSDNIEAIWKFENNILDSNNKHNLSNFGMVTYESCKNNNCTHLDGITNYWILNATAQKLSGVSTGLTFAMWLKFDAVRSTPDYFFQFDTNINRYFSSGVYDATNLYWWFGDNSDGGTVSPASLVNNQWYFFTYVWNKDSNSTIYLNGTKWATIHTDILTITWDTSQPQWLGNLADAPTRFFDGSIDEFYIWNRSLNASEVAQLWNNSYGDFYPFSDTPLGASPNITRINLLDANFNKIDLFSYAENQLFWYGINYTYANNSVITSGNCNMSIQNVTAVKQNISLSNFTINDTTQNVSINFSESAGVNDKYKFFVCSQGINVGAYVYINNALFSSISSPIIPSCSLGTHQEINISTVNTMNTNNFITIKCNNCNFPARTLKIVSQDGYLLQYQRRLSNHTENLVYNSSTNLYNFLEHYYLISFNGTTNIQGKCDNIINISTLNIALRNLSINILSINNIAYTDGMIIEIEENNNISIDVFNKSFSYLQMNVTYPNNTLIKSVTNQEFISVNQTELISIGTYNISINTIDIDGNTINKKGYFVVNDTTIPSISFISPMSDNTSTFVNGTSFSVNASFYDVNLYAYEVLFYNPIGNLIYNFTKEYINTTTEYLLQTINANETGIWTIRYNVTDSHTATEIPVYENVIQDRSIIINDKLEYDENDKLLTDDAVKISYTGKYNLDKINLVKQSDRYNFGYEVSLGADSTLKEVDQQFKVECQDLHYIKDKYIAHFVCWKDKKWVDFLSKDIISYYVVSCGTDCFYVNAKMMPSKNIVFNSIGGLNSNSGEIRYTVTVPVTASLLSLYAFNLSNPQNIIILFVMAFLYIGVMVLAFTFKNFGFLSMGIFLGMIIGLMLITLSVFLTLMFLLINILFFFSTKTHWK